MHQFGGKARNSRKNLRGLPFRPSEFPVLEDYGATLAEAEAAEDKALAEIQAERKAGKVFEFNGNGP